MSDEDSAVEETTLTPQPAAATTEMTPEETEAYTTALAEKEAEDNEVVWVYEPDAAHQGAAVPGVPPRDITARDMRTRHLTDEQLAEYPQLYRQAGKE